MGGLKSHPGWAFLLLKKSDLSSVSGIAASSFFFFFFIRNVPAFVQDKGAEMVRQV